MRDQPLTTEEFAVWYHMAIRARQMQTKQGREQIRLAAQAHTLFGERDALSVTTSSSSSVASGAGGATAGQETLAQAAWATTTTPSSENDDGEQALQAVLRGGAIPAWMFARADLMLRVLPPDDPRARYLRAGGKLDERGLPIIVEFDRTRRAPITRTVPTTDDPPTASASDVAPPPPPAFDAATPTTTDDDDDDLDDATRDIWRQAQRHLPTLPPLP